MKIFLYLLFSLFFLLDITFQIDLYSVFKARARSVDMIDRVANFDKRKKTDIIRYLI